jgi:predicted nuclease of predicted toxin-antitoxin system
VLEKAVAKGRVVVTHDLDFGEIVAASGGRLPSVITFRLRDMRVGNVTRHLEALLQNHRDEMEKGSLVSVTEGRIRVRSLPII